MTDLPRTPAAEELFHLIFRHQRIPTYIGLGQRCTGCDHLNGETDGPNSPRQAQHLVDLIIAAGWVDREQYRDQVKRVAVLETWKAEAMEVMSGLEDLGKALELPFGESITGTVAAERVARLKEALEALGRERNTWARQMADLRDEMETAAERARQDADNANETERLLRAELDLRRELVEQAAYQGRRTTLDPGAFVARGRDDDGDYERMDQWRERALRHGLAKIWEAAEERRAGQ